MRRRRLIAVALVAVYSFAVQAKEFNHHRFIVKINNAAKSLSLKKSNQYTKVEPLVEELGLYLVESNTLMNHKSMMTSLRNEEGVERVQKDYLLKRRTPNDPELERLWSLFDQYNQADINTEETWNKYGTGGVDALGNDVVVAVVDGGIDFSHPDIAPNKWVNKNEIPGNNIDDDGNGYVDDIVGWNAYEDNGNVDVDRHGTHVAGTVGARGNNNVGIVGVNWNVKIMGISMFEFSTVEVLRAYNYIYKQKKLYLETNGEKGANVVVTNSSFGVDRADCNSDEFKSWNEMYSKMGTVGILSAAATINSGIDVDEIGDVPTGCDSDYIVTVTNTNKDNEKSPYAGYGKTSIDVGAPGTEIYSTLPDNQYGLMTGTSMATPHVAGTIALLHAVASENFADDHMNNPAQAALTLKSILLDNVDNNSTLEGITVTGGKINVFKSATEISRY